MIGVGGALSADPAVAGPAPVEPAQAGPAPVADAAAGPATAEPAGSTGLFIGMAPPSIDTFA